MKGKTTLVVVLVILIAIAGVLILPAIGFHNREVLLRNNVTTQQRANEAVFDRVWKVLSQQAQVAKEHKEAFKEIYTEIMGNSTGGSQRLLGFIQSVNPQFDQSSFTNLQTSIEANRRDFEREQVSLLGKWESHKNHLERFPNVIYASVLGRDAIDVTIVTSGKTGEAFRTGEENEDDLDLFKGDG